MPTVEEIVAAQQAAAAKCLEMRRDAFSRYEHDAVFHARCKLAVGVLQSERLINGEDGYSAALRGAIMSLHLADIPVQELVGG